MTKKILKQHIVLWFFGLLLAGIIALIFFPKVLPPSMPSEKHVVMQTNLETFSGHSLSPLISNQWYSSLYTSFPTQPLFAQPLAFQINPSGLGVSYPSVQKSADTIIAPYHEDFIIGYANGLGKPKIVSVGDWTIGISQTTDANETMSSLVGHGLPFTTVQMTGMRAIMTFSNFFSFYNENANTAITNTTVHTQSFVIETNTHAYIITLLQKEPITIAGQTISIANPQQVFIGLLDKREHYNLFKKIANIQIQDTKAYPTIADNKLITDFQITTNGITPLIALYPHQFDTLSNQQQVLGSYQTIRGPLRLIQSASFSTRTTLDVPDTGYGKLTNDYSDLTAQIKTDIAAVIKNGPPDSKDYYLGKWFGKISNLLLLADMNGLENEKHSLLHYAEPIFLKGLDNFYYDKNKSSLIAKYPEFGNENLNDHHFHYGYFIRTAAVLSSFDLSFLPKIQDKTNDMVSDIATLERDNTHFPFLRNFDAYENHSWADGYADFSDGNNQESSSEAINAWYSLYLWSKITNDVNLEKYSLYLYNAEIQGAKYYWFNDTNLYASPYQHGIFSMLWGDKVTFATWFSNTTNMKYGIQLLPFTPASSYLAELSNFKKYPIDYHASSGDEAGQWGDLFVMWESYYDPKSALLLKDTIKQFEDGNSKSVFLYTLYANAEKLPTISPSP